MQNCVLLGYCMIQNRVENDNYYDVWTVLVSSTGLVVGTFEEQKILSVKSHLPHVSSCLGCDSTAILALAWKSR